MYFSTLFLASPLPRMADDKFEMLEEHQVQVQNMCLELDRAISLSLFEIS